MVGMERGRMVGGGNVQRMIEPSTAWMESKGGETHPQDQTRWAPGIPGKEEPCPSRP